jgi:transposase-like protein
MGDRWNHDWTPERIVMLTEHYGSGGGLSEIARRWGISRSAVIGKWNRLINETAAAAEWEGELLDAMCDALADEVSFDTIAGKLGISVGGVMAAFAVLRRQMGVQAR